MQNIQTSVVVDSFSLFAKRRKSVENITNQKKMSAPKVEDRQLQALVITVCPIIVHFIT